MRLDHLLSKEKEEVGVVLLSSCQGVHKIWTNDNRMKLTFLVACAQSASLSRNKQFNISGGDALRGHTRSHPEHDG